MTERTIAAREDDEMGETVGELADIGNIKLDLTKDEKVRTVSLMLGIRYYCDTIIKDAAYLQAMIAREKEMQFSNDPDKDLWHLRPANVGGVISCALEFERFLRGEYSAVRSIKVGGEEINHAVGARARGDVAADEQTAEQPES